MLTSSATEKKKEQVTLKTHTWPWSALDSNTKKRSYK